MSVTATGSLKTRPYSGFIEKGLPVGIWTGEVQVVANGTGGTSIARINFQEATLSRFYWFLSLEQLMIKSVNAADFTLRMRTQNLDENFSNDPVWGIRMQAIEVSTPNSAIEHSDANMFLKATFLGRVRFKETTSFIAWDMANVNGEVLTVLAQGYIWEPDAVNAPGGLRRPAQGLYGG